MVQCENGYNCYELRAVDDGIFRLRVGFLGEFHDTLLSRYKILHEQEKMKAEQIQKDGCVCLCAAGKTATLDPAAGTLCIAGGKKPLQISFSALPGQKYLKGEGFTLTIPLEPQERLFGIGDEGRTSIARRGTICDINIVNVQAYGPVPYLMSTGGWSILVNCTYPQIYDLGKTDPDRIVLTAENGYVDFYIFLPADGSIAGNLELSTRITGRPLLMPKSFYGFTFVFNEMTDARHMLYECKMFRDDDIPVDTVGLEPQWMEKMYDFSTDKKWDQGRFWFPDWEPANNSGNWTFGWALRNLGFKLSLWLCNNYDLLWEEERQAGCFDKPKEINYSYTDAMIRDGHFANSTFIDEITKRDEAWFTHLEKFVDNGAAGFKMDGCSQVTHHPDRYWACKYHDDEVHNVYPVIYAKQMKEGFQRHTKGRRAVLYTPCVYAGTQQYAAEVPCHHTTNIGNILPAQHIQNRHACRSLGLTVIGIAHIIAFPNDISIAMVPCITIFCLDRLDGFNGSLRCFHREDFPDKFGFPILIASFAIGCRNQIAVMHPQPPHIAGAVHTACHHILYPEWYRFPHIL